MSIDIKSLEIITGAELPHEQLTTCSGLVSHWLDANMPKTKYKSPEELAENAANSHYAFYEDICAGHIAITPQADKHELVFGKNSIGLPYSIYVPQFVVGSLVVAKDFSGNGIASRLVAHACTVLEDYAANMKADELSGNSKYGLILASAVVCDDSLKAFKKQGFRSARKDQVLHIADDEGNIVRKIKMYKTISAY